ncbi:MAG: hypothetical protein GY826_28930 [Fuerstiella sp.]|nr:hypothetical protein [Fuerstiella sp.]
MTVPSRGGRHSSLPDVPERHRSASCVGCYACGIGLPAEGDGWAKDEGRRTKGPAGTSNPSIV